MENGGQSVARLEAEDVFDEAPLGISAGIKGLLFVMKLPQIAIQQISQHKSPSTQVSWYKSDKSGLPTHKC